MIKRFRFFLFPLLVGCAVSACTSPNHVLVKKTDLEAADQCLQAQQAGQVAALDQQQTIADTLALLHEFLDLHRQKDQVLRELIHASPSDPNPSDGQVCQPAGEFARASVPLDKVVVGGREKLLLTDLGIVLQARVDTGAATASLDARDVELFERDGERWVRFKIYDPDTDDMIELERRRVRRVLITQSNVEEPERRPVVEMRITLGELTQMSEFTLSNRSHLEHPVLIGRNVLRDVMVVDVAKTNVTEPRPPRPANNGR